MVEFHDCGISLVVKRKISNLLTGVRFSHSAVKCLFKTEYVGQKLSGERSPVKRMEGFLGSIPPCPLNAGVAQLG